jgi:DNA-directed RNA polymerase subunit M/transcription elongation factor TFIIS
MGLGGIHMAVDFESEKNDTVELTDGDLVGISGGAGRFGGYSYSRHCPRCGSQSIVYDESAGRFVSCNDCGYRA